MLGRVRFEIGDKRIIIARVRFEIRIKAEIIARFVIWQWVTRE